MDYFLYQGCSLEASASNYMVSVEKSAKMLDIKWHEIEDWNCCGASIAYIGGNEMSVKVLAARNLALAEAQGGYDIVAPCSSCYIVMNKINHELRNDPKLLAKINEILAEGGLKYSGKLKARHYLDVIYNDVGIDKIKSKVVKPLSGIKVAPYYGCQTTRPYGEYDSMEKPHVQDDILAALGATVVDFDKKVSCCGSGIFLTEMENCAPLVADIMNSAKAGGAEMIAVACPMCQMNLEVYQPKINAMLGTNFKMPIVFISQLMALAFGQDMASAAALNRNVVPPESILQF